MLLTLDESRFYLAHIEFSLLRDWSVVIDRLDNTLARPLILLNRLVCPLTKFDNILDGCDQVQILFH